jgi:hypothetical protein
MHNISQSRFLIGGVLALALSLSACSGGSDAASTATIAKDAATTSTTLKTATTTPAAPKSPSDTSAEVLAQAFDREIRSITSFNDTANNNPNDTDPRRTPNLLEMAFKGDIPDATVAGTALGSNQLRVLVWQGAGAATVKWTRLSCPSGDCSSVDYASGSTASIMTSTTGENSKLFSPTLHPNICLQFHKGGLDVWMSVSSAANTPSVISPSLETACPASVFPGITAATGTTYADLSATPAAALIDQNW